MIEIYRQNVKQAFTHKRDMWNDRLKEWFIKRTLSLKRERKLKNYINKQNLNTMQQKNKEK